jgi:transposase-like protein
MGTTWSSESAENESCPKCNSIYKVKIQHFPMRDSDYFNCEVCNYEMNRWNDTASPSYELIKRGSLPSNENA